jgi:hypothetical protein
MNGMEKNTVLLLGHSNLQERYITLTLTLGGYEARVVRNEYEAINMVKTMRETVHSVIISGTGSQMELNEKLMRLGCSNVSTPVVIVGLSDVELERNRATENFPSSLKLTCCGYDQLLQNLKVQS